jgi:hypothetical protein
MAEYDPATERTRSSSTVRNQAKWGRAVLEPPAPEVLDVAPRPLGYFEPFTERMPLEGSTRGAWCVGGEE